MKLLSNCIILSWLFEVKEHNLLLNQRKNHLTLFLVFFMAYKIVNSQVTLPTFFCVTWPTVHSSSLTAQKMKYLVILLFGVLNYSFIFDFYVGARNLLFTIRRLFWKCDVTSKPLSKKSNVTDELWIAVVPKLRKLEKNFMWTKWRSWSLISYEMKKHFVLMSYIGP